MSTPIVYRYEVDPIWKADVERLLAEAKAAPGERVPAERLRDYLIANRNRAVKRVSREDALASPPADACR